MSSRNITSKELSLDDLAPSFSKKFMEQETGSSKYPTLSRFKKEFSCPL